MMSWVKATRYAVAGTSLPEVVPEIIPTHQLRVFRKTLQVLQNVTYYTYTPEK
jgi:hypothetical protein